MVLMLLAISSSVEGTTINVRNQCPITITACDQAQGTGVSCFVLGSGQSNLLNVGSAWPGGLIWGYPGTNRDPNFGNSIKPQADLAEFSIGLSAQDFYDLSNVNAYNLPLEISPTQIAGGGQPNGHFCGSPSCTIPNLGGFCQSPNSLTGPPADGCINKDGPGTVPTSGTIAFHNACPNAFSYSQDNQATYACSTGSNYEVVFCP